MTDEPPGYSLLHPVYLDVPMMISFLAHLEGGVATHEEETKKEVGARERALKGRAGLRLRFVPALDVDVGSEGSTQRRDESSLESKTERHHTAASLFNLLYDYLKEDNQLVSLRDKSQLDTLESGQLVEVGGEYVGNPLEDLLAFFGVLLPYIAQQQEAQKALAGAVLKSLPKSPRPGNAPKRAGPQVTQDDLNTLVKGLQEVQETQAAEFGVQMMLRMVEDIAQVPVHDLLLKTSTGLQAVLTVSSDYYSSATNEYLRAGEFRAIGKVTRIIDGERTINLTRRTVFRAASPARAQELMASVSSGEMQLEVADPIVTAPAVQILPMAIFL